MAILAANELLFLVNAVRMIDGDLPPYIKAWLQLGHGDGPTRCAQITAKNAMLDRKLATTIFANRLPRCLPIAAAYPDHSNSTSKTVHTNVSGNKATPNFWSRNNTEYQGNGSCAREMAPFCGPAPSQDKTDLKGQEGQPIFDGTEMVRGNGTNNCLYGALPTAESVPSDSEVNIKLEGSPKMACSKKMPITPSNSNGPSTPPSQSLSTSGKRRKRSPPVSANPKIAALVTLTLAFRGVHQNSPNGMENTMMLFVK